MHPVSVSGFENNPAEALGTALFRDGELSLARAARVAGLDMACFISHLSRLGIPAIRLSAAETLDDLDTLEEAINSCRSA
jgi:hypothetical protein